MSLAEKALRIYNQIPLGILNCVAPFYHMLPQSVRYGKTFHRTYQSLMEKDRIRDQQAQQKTVQRLFLQTVRQAYENVPYYRKLFQENNIDVYAFTSIKDIQKLPFLTKEQIREKADELLCAGTDRNRLLYVTTSGSTGTPLEFYQDREILMKEWAYVNYLWARAGYRPDSSRLVLRGKVFRNQKIKGADWQWDALKRELSCNIFSMSEKNMELYCSKIETYQPEYIHGYMSAVVTLCRYIEKRGLAHKFLGVLAVSETVSSWQREYVQRVLGARVFSFYGHSERLVIAAECGQGTDYHIEPEYGYAELIDRNGRVITEPGIEGELVATGFLNTSMPLIRYRTGDLARWSSGPCACGRKHMRLENVTGRWQDVLVNKEQAFISIAAVNMHSDLFAHVTQYQFYQDTVGKMVFKMVPAAEFTQEDQYKIQAQFAEKFGSGMEVVIEQVTQIPLCSNGKYKMTDQRLNLRRLDGNTNT